MKSFSILGLTAAASLALAACSSSTPSIRPNPNVFEVQYRCQNGENITVRYFHQQGIAVLQRSGQNIELNRTSNAPVTYQGGQTMIVTNEGRMNVTMTVGMMAPTVCNGQRASGNPPPPPRPPVAPAPPIAPPPPAPNEIRTNFVCDNGERIALRQFPQQGIAVLVHGGQNIELQSQNVPGGSFVYSNGQTTVAGTPSRVTLNVGMKATATCTPA